MTSTDAPVALVQPHVIPAPSPHTGRIRQALASLREQAEPVEVPAVPSPAATLSREQILDATEACLRQTGYDGTTIRRIAARLGCAVGTIYRYFTDKRQLLDAVTQRRFEPVAHLTSSGAAMEETAALYARIAAEEPQQYRLMFWLSSLDRPDRPGLPAIIQEILDHWTRKLRDPLLAQRAWAAVHGGVMLGLEPAQVVQQVRLALQQAAPAASASPGASAASAAPAQPEPISPDASGPQASPSAKEAALPVAVAGSSAAAVSLRSDDVTLL
ncbi:MAG TPA: helix-turn-helix domain-containing protein [Phycisphaeraceae bacterium]